MARLNCWFRNRITSSFNKWVLRNIYCKFTRFGGYPSIEVKMRRFISSRFNVIKVLRDGRGTSTLLASELWPEKGTVLIKTFHRDQFNSERPAVEKTLSIFMGMRHPHIIPISDVGVSKSEDFY